MSYAAPNISSAGLTLPLYNDILDYLIEQFRSIYGQDVYLGNDSSDYQMLSIVALMMHDSMQTAQLAYNNRGPLTAVGSGLDQIVAINGIARKTASYSTCEVVLAGTIGTVINNGRIRDANGFKWALPASVTLVSTGSPATGQATEVATCETIGAINALPGDLSAIFTPTAGWTSVTNDAAAVAGLPIETDAQLRARQSLSVERPSMNLLTGTWSALSSLANVTRVNVLENNTNFEDANGLPPHSISCIVEGATDAAVAQVIWENRGIGPLTNPVVASPDLESARHVDIVDPISSITTTINFYRPTYVPIFVTLEVTALAGYTSATTISIEQAIVAYLNSLQIGEGLTISALYGAALSVMPNLSRPLFSITALFAGAASSPQFSTDITIAIDEVTQGIEVGYITVNVS